MKKTSREEIIKNEKGRKQESYWMLTRDKEENMKKIEKCRREYEEKKIERK